MRPYIFLIALFLNATTVAQPVQKIQQLLKNKSFVPFKKYVDDPPKSNVDISWNMLRTIVSGNQEGIVKIEENLPLNDGSGGSVYNNYSIQLLATADKIFYYRFTKTINKKIGPDQWQPHEELIEEIRDDSTYLNFSDLFKQTYGDTIHPYDLFYTDIVFGEHCGMTGIDPTYKQELDALLQTNNVDAIRQWLRSANAEKQLYALLGYKILINEDYSLTIEESKIINVVKQKKGMVSICSGCIFSTKNFEDVVAEIDAIPTKYLKTKKVILTNSIAPKKKQKEASNNIFWVLGIGGFILLITILYFRRNLNNQGI